MPTATITQAASIGGISISGTASRTASGQISHQVEVPGGKATSSWTKTDADTANCVLAANHGYANAVMDVFWNGGIRYGVTGVVDNNALSLEGGAGTDFPNTNTTGVIVCTRTQVNIDVDADDAEIVMAHAAFRSHIDWQDSGNLTIAGTELTAGEVWQWVKNTGITNPLTGNAIDKAYVSTGTTSNATVKIGVLYDSEV